ncbi:MAG: [Fe-Fe] hydrogenase large subunit C-terminal domain-containing protein [Candidatus Sumerlaeia bacterium]
MQNPVTRAKDSIVFTNQAKCRDCYRCVRTCPVKAIRVVNAQASVVAERCIHCGTCIRECPQKAKAYRNDIERVRDIVREGAMTALSIAPSFAGFFREWEWKRIPSALRKLGFRHVSETAVGAWHAAQKTAALLEHDPKASWIESSCPAVVSYVEKYLPDRVRNLAPILSPMLTHASLLRQKLGGDIRVIFIGPCVAKKAEAERSENDGLVDGVLTFAELGQWLEEENIDLRQLEESDFDEQPAGHARCYPLLGGCMQTAARTADRLAADVLSASGHEQIHEALTMEDNNGLRLIECLFCPDGCIGGPAIPQEGNPFERRQRVLRYAGEIQKKDTAPELTALPLVARFHARPIADGDKVSEEAIRRELEKTGKLDPDNQLNCGACGYPRCREKAIATILGMAETEMCLPYMRRMAEGRTDRIIETSPNGIILLDERLCITAMNPAFRKLFYCSDAVLGKPVSYLMDPDPFERLAAGKEQLIEKQMEHRQYNRVCHQIAYALEDEKQFVGIFVNITEQKDRQHQLDKLRKDAMVQARELLDHQLQMAQEMTRFLGENTARGESLVEKLVDLVGDNGGGSKELRP